MTTEIHPTAIVHSGAEIDMGCTIGPYCVIGEKVKLGHDSRLQSHVVLDGKLEIGAGAEIFPFACLGKITQDLKYEGLEGQIKIGSNTTIREYVTVHMPTGDGLTYIGNNCHLLAYSHIAHDCQVGDHVVMSNSTHLAGHVIIEDRVIFGGLIGVHQFCRIGTMSMIGAHSKVAQDIVPYSLADGNPALPRTVNKIGMTRNGLAQSAVKDVSRAHRLLFREGLTLDKAVEQINSELVDRPELTSIIEFVRNSERGLARPPVRKRQQNGEKRT